MFSYILISFLNSIHLIYCSNDALLGTLCFEYYSSGNDKLSSDDDESYDGGSTFLSLCLPYMISADCRVSGLSPTWLSSMRCPDAHSSSRNDSCSSFSLFIVKMCPPRQ